MQKKPNQYTSILDYLLAGHAITSKQAFEMFGCTRLSAKIFDMRKAGYNVKCERTASRTRYGTPSYYGVYYLVK